MKKTELERKRKLFFDQVNFIRNFPVTIKKIPMRRFRSVSQRSEYGRMFGIYGRTTEIQNYLES